MYYTYMIRCKDNSIYTGMTNNLEKRFNEHLLNKDSQYKENVTYINLLFK